MDEHIEMPNIVEITNTIIEMQEYILSEELFKLDKHERLQKLETKFSSFSEKFYSILCLIAEYEMDIEHLINMLAVLGNIKYNNMKQEDGVAFLRDTLADKYIKNK
jgi:hypothetical protein